MSTSECSDDFLIKIVSAIIFLSFIIFFLRKFFKKNIPSTEFSKTDISAILECKTELAIQLKKISQKTSEEAHLLSAGLCNLNNLTSIQLKQRCASLQEQMDATLSQDRLKTERQLENLERRILDLRKEVQTLWDSQKGKFRLEGKQGGYGMEYEKVHVVEDSTTQTLEEDGTDEVHDKCVPEVPNYETTEVILLNIKDCMDQIVSESIWNREDFYKEISSFVQKHYKNIQELTYSLVNERLEKLRQLQIDILMMNTENIEKRLLDVFIFLDRKFVDVQAIEETLKFFNRKFVNFADKCEVRWNDSCSKFDDSQELVFEARDNLIFSSSKMARISCQLSQHASELETMAKTLRFAIQKAVAIAKAEYSSRSSRDRVEEVVHTVESMQDTIARIGEEYSGKLSEVATLLEMPSKRLETFFRYVEDLEVLNDLLKNKREMYENTTKQPLNNGGQGNKDQLGFPEYGKEVETSSMISGDECSSYQDGDGFTDFSFDFNQSKNDENFIQMEGDEREKRRPFTLKSMISVLGDVIRKTAVDLRENDAEYHRKLKEELQMEPSVQDRHENKSFNWSSVPSEVCLSDINNDCLIRNYSSSSSDEEQCKL